MIFFGSFFGADEMSIPITPTFVEIKNIELSDALYDDLYVTKDVSFEMNEDYKLKWDYNTIMYAPFDESALAGNINQTLDTISHLLIKRRKKDTYEWTTIKVVPIKNVEDLNIYDTDMTARINVEYEYAAVPVYNGKESVYSIAIVKCECNSLVITDKDSTWTTMISDSFCDTTRTYPVQMLGTMYSKYPTAVRNTYQNYDVINVSGTWLPNKEDSCDMMIEEEYDSTRTDYSKSFIDFLTNNKAKLIKNIDGRMWLCFLSGDITDSADSVYNNRQISFSMTETGDYTSSEDLYDNGFNQSVTEEWW